LIYYNSDKYSKEVVNMPHMRIHPHSGTVLFHRTPQEQEERRKRKELSKHYDEVQQMKEELASKLKEVDEVLSKLKGKG